MTTNTSLGKLMNECNCLQQRGPDINNNKQTNNGGSFFSGQTPGLHLRQAPPNQTGRRPGEARETPGPPACNSRWSREATTSPTAHLHSDGGPVQIPTNFSQRSRIRTFSLLIPPSSPVPFRAAKHSRKSSTMSQESTMCRRYRSMKCICFPLSRMPSTWSCISA